MENFQGLTVKQLQSKCKEAGLPCSGKKNQLIERLERKYSDPGVNERIAQLEKTIADLRVQSARFQPTDTSSMRQSFVSPCGSPIRALSDGVSLPHQPVSSVGSRIATPSTTVYSQQPLTLQPSSSYQSHVGSRIPATSSTTVYSQQPVTLRPSSSLHAAPPRYTYDPPVCIPYTVNPHVQPITSCYVTNTHPQMLSSDHTFAPRHVHQNSSLPNVASPPNVFIQHPIAPPVQPIQNHIFPLNPFGNVREMIALLPEFNPSSDESVNSSQFIKRIETLKAAYGWDDQSLIFAVQQKMLGPAKYWVDSLQTVFLSWQQFVQKFLRDFPHINNAADIHIKMSQMKRKFNESPQEYYFKMFALGTKGNLPESAIARHIVNGINDPNLKRKISNEYSSCNQLYRDINSYCNYNEVATPVATMQKPKPTPLNEKFSANSGVQTKTNNDNNNNNAKVNRIKCYNCFNYGHYSIKCPEPQRKERCKKCNRTTHRTTECTVTNDNNQKPASNVSKICDESESTADLTKNVRVNNIEAVAFVDSGSSYNLVRKSFAANLGENTPCMVLLKGFAGGEYKCTNKVTATLEIDGNVFETDMLIVEDDFILQNILLGRDVICRKGSRTIIEGDECRIQNVNVINSGNNLTSNENDRLQAVLKNHRASFAENISELGKCSLVKMEINLKSNEPVCSRPYRIAFSKRPVVEKIVNELLENGIIRESESEYASGIVLVEKKNGEHRLCVDYRQLNRITTKIPYPMPIIDEQFALMAGNKFFTTLDLRMGYHQIEIDENSRKYTAFVTTGGHYEFNRMPFGLVNAPAIFQAVMNRIARRMKPGEVLVYLDDVIIPSKTVEEGIERLDHFLGVLEDSGLTLRLDKCDFLLEEISYLGHKVSGHGITPGDNKVSAIKNFKVPSNVTEVRRFLGLTGFFRKFVPNYSIISRPLTDLLRKNEEQNFQWGSSQQESFEKLVDILCSKPLLANYDFKATHEVHTDASSIGLAGVLLQSSDGESWHPVFYFSRHTTETESKYHSYELEVLAVVETLERFRIYLVGKPFRILTDCAAITKAKSNKELLPRIARWFMKLLEYDCEFVHREGSRMSHVDALSRSPDQPPKEAEPAGFVMKINESSEDWVLTMQLQDEQLRHIIGVLNGSVKSDQAKQFKTDYVVQNHRLYRKTEHGPKLVVPKSTRWRIAKLCHDDVGHYGLEKTLERIKQTFWFNRMRKYVKEYIAACADCCYNKSKSGKREGVLHYGPLEPIPFRQIHIDHLGPFIRSKKGNTHILAISDAFTKFIVVKAVRNTKTAPVINALNELTGYFGLPKRIISDRGTAFTSKIFEDYCDRNNIQHVKSAVRTPRANGQVERANQIILNYLRTTTNESKDWDLHLHNLQWSVNSQRNNTSGFSPNELIFDYKLIDLAQNRILAAIQDDFTDDQNIPIDEKRKLAALNIEREREKWKRRFDSKHNTPTVYQENDLVVLENEPQSTGESRKLEPKYRGPYIVSRVLGNDRYLIEDIPGILISPRKFCSVYSADKMKRWCEESPDLGFEEDGVDEEAEDVFRVGLAELSTAK